MVVPMLDSAAIRVPATVRAPAVEVSLVVVAVAVIGAAVAEEVAAAASRPTLLPQLHPPATNLLSP